MSELEIGKDYGWQDLIFLEVTKVIIKYNPEIETIQKLEAFLQVYREKKEEVEKLQAPLSWN